MSVTITTTATTAPSTTTNTTEQDEQNGSEVQLDKDGETYRKLFVGGLSWQTTEDNLQRYFQTLGLTVERVLIMREKASGRSRGFGFVILKHQDMVDKALSLPLQLDGRKIEAKRAISKRDIEKSHKIFVGGIPMSLTQTDFKKFFEGFGAVTDCQIMMERDSGRSRGFGFVTFEEESSMEKVLATQHSIQGKPVEVKRAEPKKKEVAPVPIIVPVPTYFPSGYSYPVAYAPNSYGQALAYDGQNFIAVYPQYNLADGQYEQYYSALTPGAGGLSPVVSPVTSPVASPVVTPVISPVTSPDGENSSAGRHRQSRRDNATSPSHSPSLSPSLSPASPSSSLSSLAERVRVLEVRKKRGLSNPEQVDPRARKHASSTGLAPSISSVSTGRKSVVPINNANWRSRGNAVTATTATSTTTATTSTTATTATSSTSSSSQKGGALHKYFQ